MPDAALIALDCDGVILDTVDVKTNAFAAVASRYGQEASERLVAYHLRHGGVSRQAKFTWLYRELTGGEIPAAELAELCGDFAARCRDGVLRAPFLPGALECIRAVSGHIPLHVVSGTPRAELRNVFERRDLARFFDGLWGTPPEKTALLVSVVKASGLAADRVLMVGDSVTDLEAATAAGTLFHGIGANFKDSSWPWSEDMRGLLPRLQALAGEKGTARNLSVFLTR